MIQLPFTFIIFKENPLPGLTEKYYYDIIEVTNTKAVDV